MAAGPDSSRALVTSRAAISRVLHGADDRLVVVVCSIHDHAQAMDYAHNSKPADACRTIC
jgi:3-deoxy-7-phosphoheptulonate synthase